MRRAQLVSVVVLMVVSSCGPAAARTSGDDWDVGVLTQGPLGGIGFRF